MNLFQKRKTKKIILNNILKANTIFKQAEDCLIPANNIYWCSVIDVHNSFTEGQHLLKLNKSIPLLISHLDKIMEIYNANLELCCSIPEYEAISTPFFIKNFTNLLQTIESRTNDLESIDNYSFDKDLKSAVSLLKTASSSITICLDNISNVKNTETSI